jgi:hypothetical protein
MKTWLTICNDGNEPEPPFLYLPSDHPLDARSSITVPVSASAPGRQIAFSPSAKKQQTDFGAQAMQYGVT